MMIARFLLVFLLASFPTAALADGFLDWWLTPDQQGRLYFQRGNFQKSARAFEQEKWKAVAFYNAGDFSNAATLLEKDQSAEGQFFLGNALAKQEKLEPAIQAYKQALQLKPDFSEATFNLDWVEGLLELSKKEYEDAGGTGGKLGADRVVYDERGAQAKGEVSMQELQSEKGLSDEEIQTMWMRRVQTTPGDFLAYKFNFQQSARETETKADPQ